MIKQLIDLIVKKGLREAVLDPAFANRLYTRVSTAIAGLWAFNNLLGSGDDYPEDSYEVVAVESSFGAAKAIAVNGTANVVEKLGSKSVKVDGIKFLESINFQESEVKNISKAMKGSAVHLKVAARAFIMNALHLQTRLAVALELMYWQGIYNAAMTVTMKGGTTMDILTGTTVLTPKAGGAKWDAPTTAKPFADLKVMRESFLGTGFKPDTLVMTTPTYNKMMATESVLASLTEIERSLVEQGKQLTSIGDYHLHIYDATYKASKSATPTSFVPNGMVIMAQFIGAKEAVRRINMLNMEATIDGELRETTGEFFDTQILAKPARVVLSESFAGILSFEQPQAFVSQAMY